jgi:hypothetical protein
VPGFRSAGQGTHGERSAQMTRLMMVAYWQILLQKSKIEQSKKSRES